MFSPRARGCYASRFWEELSFIFISPKSCSMTGPKYPKVVGKLVSRYWIYCVTFAIGYDLVKQIGGGAFSTWVLNFTLFVTTLKRHSPIDYQCFWSSERAGTSCRCMQGDIAHRVYNWEGEENSGEGDARALCTQTSARSWIPECCGGRVKTSGHLCARNLHVNRVCWRWRSVRQNWYVLFVFYWQRSKIVCIAPDIGVDEDLAHYYFLQLISGMVKQYFFAIRMLLSSPFQPALHSFSRSLPSWFETWEPVVRHSK